MNLDAPSPRLTGDPSTDLDLETVGWRGDARGGCVRLIDQTRLPTEFLQIDCRDVPTVWEAIKSLRVRGAAPLPQIREHLLELPDKHGALGPGTDKTPLAL